jgi:iduronate 2-sulfatase
MNKASFTLLLICGASFLAACNEAEPDSEDKQEKMNALFIVVDDFRPEIHATGRNEVITPNVDRLAGEGMYFSRAYCQWPVCGPSRTSFMSGLRPENKSTPGVGHTSLPGHFRANGYYTASIGKIYHNQNADQDSWNFIERGRWQNYGNEANYSSGTGERLLFEKEDLPDHVYSDGKTTETALRLLDVLEDTSFFMAVGFYKPHMPFAAPRKYWDMYDPSNLPAAPFPDTPKGVGPAVYRWTELKDYGETNWTDTIFDYRESYLPDEIASEMVHGYYACVSFIDAQIGKLLDKLDELDLDQKTVVYLISDHGWHLGDQNIWGKHTLFERSAMVPMIIRSPGMKLKGETSNAIVELVDVYPTLAELCGLPAPETDGVSLKPILFNEENTVKSEAFTHYAPSWIPSVEQYYGTSIITDDYRYTLWQDKTDGYKDIAGELYDFTEVSEESENIADKESYSEIEEMLHQKIIDHLKK